jgi:6-pyruvoyltetrahydropterin/6-carboxytetrahydropterin synthase
MDMKLTATRRFEFSYAHHLPGYKGKCVNVHGHNAILEVTVTGNDPGYGGMVFDFSSLKDVVNDVVIDKLDHKDLNNVMQIPTAENTAWKIWGLLEAALPDGVKLDKIRLSETEGSWVTLEL